LGIKAETMASWVRGYASKHEELKVQYAGSPTYHDIEAQLVDYLKLVLDRVDGLENQTQMGDTSAETLQELADEKNKLERKNLSETAITFATTLGYNGDIFKASTSWVNSVLKRSGLFERHQFRKVQKAKSGEVDLPAPTAASERPPGVARLPDEDSRTLYPEAEAGLVAYIHDTIASLDLIADPNDYDTRKPILEMLTMKAMKLKGLELKGGIQGGSKMKASDGWVHAVLKRAGLTEHEVFKKVLELGPRSVAYKQVESELISYIKSNLEDVESFIGDTSPFARERVQEVRNRLTLKALRAKAQEISDFNNFEGKAYSQTWVSSLMKRNGDLQNHVIFSADNSFGDRRGLTSSYPDVDEKLMEHITQIKQDEGEYIYDSNGRPKKTLKGNYKKNLNLKASKLKEKALEIAHSLGYIDFKACYPWIANIVKRTKGDEEDVDQVGEEDDELETEPE